MSTHALLEPARLSALLSTFSLPSQMRAAQALRLVPPVLLDVIEAGQVTLTESSHKPSPREVRRMAQGNTKEQPASCHLQAATEIGAHIGPGLPTAFSHAILRFASHGVSSDTLEQMLDKVSADGKSIVVSARQHVANGVNASLFQGLSWCREALERSVLHAKEHKLPLGGLYEKAFDRFDAEHLSAATIKVGRNLGLPDADAIGAAIFTYYMRQAGPVDVLSHIAREMIAYRYQADVQGACLLTGTYLKRQVKRARSTTFVGEAEVGGYQIYERKPKPGASPSDSDVDPTLGMPGQGRRRRSASTFAP